ncbi:conserved hypothetical protein [Nostocoides japonicum T1-X7]|uniref:Uncharacterized protein n=1 Tax=Nostocoides japonicum T1-X7 TaxID=1194083 RepID=A0A077LWL2_9MICO|nr:hypothetical protein [Tetrasphaera japonica]CCH77197.1 conserved hypothetical protein [Tetrasphaera japonica T1-X7]
MYAALWHLLPGPRWAKALQCLVLLVVVLAVCFWWVFPAIAPHMPFNDSTVDGTGAIGSVTPAAAAAIHG